MAQETDISKMETTQTAVEWLVEQLPIRILNMYHKEIEQAKAMEKEQSINDFIAGQCVCQNFGTYYQAEKNYNETYGK